MRSQPVRRNTLSATHFLWEGEASAEPRSRYTHRLNGSAGASPSRNSSQNSTLPNHGLRRRAAGFTLLEVLLTSLLASVVLVALWSLSDIYLKLFVSGERKIEETQLIRGLTQKFSKDISQVNQTVEDAPSPFLSFRSTINGIPPLQGALPTPAFGMTRSNSETMSPSSRISTSPPQTLGITRSDSGGAENARRQSDRLTPKFGLFGSSQALRLIVLYTDPRAGRQPTDLAEVLPQPGQARTPLAPELRTIEYTFTGSNESSSNENQRPAGLIRREWAWESWIGLRMASLSSAGRGAASDMIPDSHAEWTAEDAIALKADPGGHVPEVVGLEFRYYDGESWEIEWNSWERQKLPVLVEVSLRVKTSTEASKSGDNEEVSDEEDGSLSPVEGGAPGSSSAGNVNRGIWYRQLIHLPSAEERPSLDALERNSPMADVVTTAPQRGARQP